jgi:capsular exopolysaccharide synthesis family protein
MSRVDEAMKRAAEAAGTTPPEADLHLDLPSEAEVERLADEPFPVEIAERRKPRAVEPTPFAPARTPERQAPSPTSLLERIDVHLEQKVVVDINMNPVSREQYRRLAAVLHNSQATNEIKVIIVASAVAGEGKTLTASNLALTFSESYQRNVLLIDADLRKPSLDRMFNIEGAAGLSEGLISKEEKRVPVRQVSQYLSVLPAGRASSDPMARLTSDRMSRLVMEARDAFDWVIIDTPPVALLPDANLLASMADGAILVIKADSTPYPMVKLALDTLGHQRVLGALLNRATVPAHATRYGYGYDYYSGGKRARNP